MIKSQSKVVQPFVGDIAKSRWQMSRAGVTNFWYYDEEIFEFVEGKILFRGANGSGKSVTMQSLVPLLFDGDKRPTRLDPFGTSARKMDSYLLSDGLDLEDRTGYLFLEFTKPESGTTITIGMGMRARKNMPLDSWYFIVLDGRRIGPEPDFEISLVKDLGERIPLTKRELENKIGDGGRVFSLQRDYKAAVNEHIFGFEDLESFDELIALLIQLRSPKLSTAFKPTTMYGILQSALQTLSDDDLRPMSEAIESMDELKAKMDYLNDAHKALMGIKYYFDRYNALELVNKASFYLRANEQWLQHQRKQQALQEKCLQLKQSYEQTNSQIESIEQEREVHTEAIERLSQHDVTRLVTQKGDLTKVIEEKTQEHRIKLEAVEVDEVKWRRQKKESDEISSTIQEYTSHVLSRVEEMREPAELAGFDEHAFYEGERRLGDVKQDHYHQSQMLAHAKQLRLAREALTRQDAVRHQLDQTQKELNQAEHEEETRTRRLKEAAQQLTEEKDRYVERVYRWADNLDVLAITRSALGQSCEKAYQLNHETYFDIVLGPVKKEADQQIEALQTQKSILSAQMEQLRLTRQEQHQLLERLKSQKDPIPLRDPAVIANRERLTEAGIPHMPLYMAIDFTQDLSEDQRAILEEALMDMGLLDALLVPKNYRDKALEINLGHKDRYIFESPAYLNLTLAQALKPESGQLAIEASQISDVLMSILMESDSDNSVVLAKDATPRVSVSEQGIFKMGLITGTISKGQKSEYIGQASRRRAMAERIQEATSRYEQLSLELNTLESALVALTEQIKRAKEEVTVFPGISDLKLALTMVDEAQLHLEAAKQTVVNQRSRVEHCFQLLKKEQQEVALITHKIALPVTLSAYEQASSAFEIYQTLFYQLRSDSQALVHQQEKLLAVRDAIEDLELRIEESRDFLSILERETTKFKAHLIQIEAQLALADNQAIVAEIEMSTKWLQDYQSRWKNLTQKLSETQASLISLGIQEEQLAQQTTELICTLNIYAQFFNWEYALGYVKVAQESAKNIEIAKQILKEHSNLIDERKSLSELRDNLQSRILREGGMLAEYHIKRLEKFKPVALERFVEAPLEAPLEAPVEVAQLDVMSMDEVTKDKLMEIQFPLSRIDFECRASGKVLNLYTLLDHIALQIAENQDLLNERDRQLFEEILLNSISAKISAKILHSEQWVAQMDRLMGSMNTSMGLKLSLKWHMKSAEKEGQLSTSELVQLLRKESGLLTQTQRESLIEHFRSKIYQVKQLASGAEQKGFLALMKDVLDYRDWFEFQLFFTKGNEPRKVLTDNAFFTFSGGEKAMSMYVPLFSAVNAKYMSAGKDTPRIVSLDEAFAGVDEKNIQDMFRLLTELDLDYMANSQVLYGDYETVPGLAIAELIRPLNVTYVTVIRYVWNGKVRQLIEEV